MLTKSDLGFKIATLQKKVIGIINNQPRNSHSSLLLKKSSILKFEDKILINNIILIRTCSLKKASF